MIIFGKDLAFKYVKSFKFNNSDLTVIGQDKEISTSAKLKLSRNDKYTLVLQNLVEADKIAVIRNINNAKLLLTKIQLPLTEKPFECFLLRSGLLADVRFYVDKVSYADKKITVDLTVIGG
jgi:hypothetical protein